MIRLSNVCVERRVRAEQARDFKRAALDALRGRRSAPCVRQILAGVSINIEPGERVGIIGANGAGKSTLLRVIAGVIVPTRGEVEISGSVAALIELSAGFDPDLTVVDNVILNGVLLGSRRDRMMERAAAIIRFAELGGYESALIKTLSSGMIARLGFAVATDVKPDILLLDEVFAVGDERFRKVSRQRIEDLWIIGTTSVIVSHDLGLIQETCNRVVVMAKGRIAFSGEPRAAVRFYNDAIESQT